MAVPMVVNVQTRAARRPAMNNMAGFLQQYGRVQEDLGKVDSKYAANNERLLRDSKPN